MTRDLELFRQLAFSIEQRSSSVMSCELAVDGYSDQEQIMYHALLLRDAGLIHAPVENHFRRYTQPNIIIERLTNAGHDFIQDIRDENKWKVAKSVASAAHALTVPALLEILTEMAKTGLTERWGEVLQWLQKMGWQ